MPIDKPTLLEMFQQQTASLARQSNEENTAKLASLKSTLLQNQNSPKAYIGLANALPHGPERIAALREGLARCEPDLDLFREAADALEASNQTDESREVAQRALRLFPGDQHLRFMEALTLPVLYEAREQIAQYRERFSAGLRQLMAEMKLDSEEARRSNLEAVRRHNNFYLAYQAQDDRELQRQYGMLVHRIMAANYPQWVLPLEMPPLRAGKLRIGYVSELFRRHTVCKLFQGWLTEHDRSKCELFAYHIGTERDELTEEVERASDCFGHFPNDFEQTCRRILADRLHVLVFLDTGMYAPMTQLAALRLAPVQCMAWGHPVTSGLPTIDYFVSSELMEPEDGQDHYTERLIRLPGIGICYSKPVVPRPLLGKNRSDFGLGEERIVYWCGQSSFKYLPQHDDIFVRIAKRLPSAQFLFLVHNVSVGADFRRRLQRAFAAEGLVADHHCVMHPEVAPIDYWNLYILSDVFLDSLEWSGGNTTLEAIASGLPIVTMPGKFMRGRHGYGILTQLGVTETIARNKDQFVEIACRLGQDAQWRAQIITRVTAAHRSLYSDTKCVRALEDFFYSVVREHGIPA